MLKAVFDTNILISSLIKNGKPRHLWNLVTIGKIHLVLSKQILEEFVEVAAREKFRKYVTANDVRVFLEVIKDVGNFVQVKHNFKIIKEDPDDNLILNTAYDGKADYIVSGDKHLLDLKEFKGMKIVTARLKIMCEICSRKCLLDYSTKHLYLQQYIKLNLMLISYMRISVITDEISQDLEYALDFLNKVNVRYVEVRTVGGKNIVNMNPSELERTSDIIKERGFKVCCLATPYLKCFLNNKARETTGDTFGVNEENFENHIKLLEGSTNLMNLFDSKMIRIFSFWKVHRLDKNWGEIIQKTKYGLDSIPKGDFTIAIENEHTCNVNDSDSILNFIKLLDNEKLKLLWDPCNSVIGGLDYSEEFEKIKDLICHIHAKNIVYNNSSSKFEYTELSNGVINFKNLISRMKELKFSGFISLESHIPKSNKNREKLIENSINFLRECLD